MRSLEVDGVMLEEYSIDIDAEEILAKVELIKFTHLGTRVFLTRCRLYSVDFKNPVSEDKDVTLSEDMAYEKFADWKKKAKQFVVKCLESD